MEGIRLSPMWYLCVTPIRPESASVSTDRWDVPRKLRCLEQYDTHTLSREGTRSVAPRRSTADDEYWSVLSGRRWV